MKAQTHHSRLQLNFPTRNFQSFISPIAANSITLLAELTSSTAVYSINAYLFFLIKFTGIAGNPADIGFYLGVFLAVFLATQSLLAPFWGWWTDYVGRRKPFLLSGAFGTGVGFLILGFSRSYAMVVSNLPNC
jgi:MFS family permease